MDVIAEMGKTNAFTMALTGDSLITRKISSYEEHEFLEMIDILRGADVSFTNLEVLFHHYESYPAAKSGGTWLRADPALVDDLVWAGFKIVSRANNHCGDYGVQGMRLTTQHIESAGLVHAGCGESLDEAREARFLETSRGRVALVSATATFTEHSVAGKSRSNIPARPGLSPLRLATRRIMTPDQLKRLRQVLEEAGLSQPEHPERKKSKKRLKVFGKTVFAGESPGIRAEANKQDLSEIVDAVRNAQSLADYTIVSIHCHSPGNGVITPPEFLEEFAHHVIDSGADVVVGHGPHMLRGIEIYKGKPIFYSLGNFLFQHETVEKLPADNFEKYGFGDRKDMSSEELFDFKYKDDRRGFPSNAAYWESVVAVIEWMGKEVKDLRLYPVTLGFGKPRGERGRPMLAKGDIAKDIINNIREISKPFSTDIEVINGVGVLKSQEL